MRNTAEITILVVDDETILRATIARDFLRKGYKVLEAPDGKEAFRLVEANHIDVVLTDVRMPNGDGVELLERIKAKNRLLPVVMFITGFADISLADAYDKGVDVVFAKPFDRKALAEAVTRVTTPLDERWSAKRDDHRLNTFFKIKLQFPELRLETSGSVLNIGRGGMFVALSKETIPSVNSSVAFEIELRGHSLIGNGLVRWVRTESEQNTPSGCGIEFQFLNENIRRDIIEWVNALKTQSFIPKK